MTLLSRYESSVKISRSLNELYKYHCQKKSVIKQKLLVKKIDRKIQALVNLHNDVISNHNYEINKNKKLWDTCYYNLRKEYSNKSKPVATLPSAEKNTQMIVLLIRAFASLKDKLEPERFDLTQENPFDSFTFLTCPGGNALHECSFEEINTLPNNTKVHEIILEE